MMIRPPLPRVRRRTNSPHRSPRLERWTAWWRSAGPQTPERCHPGPNAPHCSRECRRARIASSPARTDPRAPTRCSESGSIPAAFEPSARGADTGSPSATPRADDDLPPKWVTNTAAPASMSSRAMAAPRPACLVTPVTTATFPASGGCAPFDMTVSLYMQGVDPELATDGAPCALPRTPEPARRPGPRSTGGSGPDPACRVASSASARQSRRRLQDHQRRLLVKGTCPRPSLARCDHRSWQPSRPQDGGKVD